MQCNNILQKQHTEILKNMAHGNSFKEEIIWKTCHFDKMHRNNYTSEISKQFLRMGHFSSVHLDFSVLDLTNLTIKWIMITNLKGDFSISHTNKHAVIARLTFGPTRPNRLCYAGHTTLTWKKFRWEIPKLLPTWVQVRNVTPTTSSSRTTTFVSWHNTAQYQGVSSWLWSSAPRFLGLRLAHVVAAPQPYSWPQLLSCFAAGSVQALW